MSQTRQSTSFRPLARATARLTDHRVLGAAALLTAAAAGLAAAWTTGYLRLDPPSAAALAQGEDGAWRMAAAAHGLLLLFFVALPAMLAGLGRIALPRLVGARGSALPRLDALALLLQAAATVAAFWALAAPGAQQGGAEGLRIGATALRLIALSLLLGATNMIATFLCLRAPDRRLGDLSPLVWALFLANGLALLFLPMVAAAGEALLSNAAAAPDAATLMRVFAQPAAAILILPALGLVSHVVERAARAPLAGRAPLIAAFACAGGLGFFAWAERLVTGGVTARGPVDALIAALALGLPVAAAIACWAATLAHGARRIGVAGFWAIGFVVLALAGGLGAAALALAGAPLAGLLHQTIGLGALFATMAGLFSLFDENRAPIRRRLALVQFWATAAGAAALVGAELAGGSETATSAGAWICIVATLAFLPQIPRALRR